jgi:hypothetical protein
MRGLLVAVALLMPAAASAEAIRPGLWETTVTVTAMQAKGVPPFALNAIKKPRTKRECITPAQAAIGPGAPTKPQPGCQALKSVMSGGTFDRAFICRKNGDETNMTMHGTYTALHYSAISHITNKGARPMTMTATSTSRWVGECK